LSFDLSERSELGLRDAAVLERRGKRVTGPARRSLEFARRRSFICPPRKLRLPSFVARQPLCAASARCRLHKPFTGSAVEFHDEQPDSLRGKLRGLFADTASGDGE